MNKLPAVAVITQLIILTFALLQNWDPYLLLFVYISELIIATTLGMFNSVRFGGAKFFLVSIFTSTVVSGIALGFIFASANILQPFDIEDISGNFTLVVLTSISVTWFALLTNSLTLLITAAKAHSTMDPFFYPLKPLIRLIPLFFVITLGGFIAILGFADAIIIGMTLMHIIVDIFLYSKEQQKHLLK